MATALDELQREVGRLRRDLANLQHESRTNQGVLAGAIRKTRNAQTEQDQRRAVARLAQPAGLVNWSPRAGDQANPDMNTSLIDRLRKGQPVADSLGNTAPFFGQTNLLADPTFENCTTSVIAVGTAETVIGRGNWFAFRSATSCTASSVREYARDDSLDNPFNTEALRLLLNISGAGTHKLTLDSDSWVNISIPILPYLVTAIRISRLFVDTHTNITSNKMFLELVDGPHGGAGVVRGSTVIDLDDLVPYKGQTQMVASSLYAGQAWVNNDFHLRVRLEVVTTGAAVVSYHVGEPQLVMTYSPDPGPFTPLLAGWQAPKLVSDGGATTAIIIDARVGTADTFARYLVTADGTTKWGPGASVFDARLRRAFAGGMLFDSNGQAVTTYLQLEATAGQSAGLGIHAAGDAADRLELRGDTGLIGISLGAGAGTRDVLASRVAAGALAITANGTAVSTHLLIGATAGQQSQITMQVSGDTVDRTEIRGDATLTGIQFGPGNAAYDVKLFRSAAGSFEFNANGQAVATTLRVIATDGQGAAVTMARASDSNYRVYLDDTGALQMGPGGATALDIRIRRGAAKNLTIDDTAGGAATLSVTGTFQINGTTVVGARKTGWAVATGTATRATFATGTVTLPVLAEHVKALIDDFHATAGHGLIGT